MRKFAFVVFNVDNTILERFALDKVTAPSGLGWKLKLTKLEGDVVDTITKVAQDKQTVKLTINFLDRAYERYSILSQWLQKYSKINEHIALEYDDETQARYVEGKVTEFSKAEKDEYGRLSCTVNFTPLTPFFVNIEKKILIYKSSKGKSYSLKYPYCYGKNEVHNDEIENPYISPVPVTITINGSVSNPHISLVAGNAEEAYCSVSFPGVTLHDGQSIVINSARRKIYFYDGLGGREEYSHKTDPSKDTFLFAESGLSHISFVFQSTDTGNITGSWRQYGL